jgi:hypothetical protein
MKTQQLIQSKTKTWLQQTPQISKHSLGNIRWAIALHVNSCALLYSFYG